MREALLKVVRSPAVRKAALTLVLAILAALGVSLGQGCVPLTPAQQAQADLFECRVRALEPSCEPALDAAELVRDAVLGKVDPVAALFRLGLTRTQVEATVKRYNDCGPKSEMPKGTLL